MREVILLGLVSPLSMTLFMMKITGFPPSLARGFGTTYHRLHLSKLDKEDASTTCPGTTATLSLFFFTVIICCLHPTVCCLLYPPVEAHCPLRPPDVLAVPPLNLIIDKEQQKIVTLSFQYTTVKKIVVYYSGHLRTRDEKSSGDVVVPFDMEMLALRYKSASDSQTLIPNCEINQEFQPSNSYRKSNQDKEFKTKGVEYTGDIESNVNGALTTHTYDYAPLITWIQLNYSHKRGVQFQKTYHDELVMSTSKSKGSRFFVDPVTKMQDNLQEGSYKEHFEKKSHNKFKRKKDNKALIEWVQSILPEVMGKEPVRVTIATRSVCLHLLIECDSCL